MVDNCDAFHLVVDGDGCAAIASKYGISVAQFQKWNPKIGTNCANLWLDAYVCVSIIGEEPKPSSTVRSTTTTKPSNGITTPTPVQDGMVGNCDAFHKVVDGDGCTDIASKYGISRSQFYAWNPAIGTDCKALWLDTYVCVSIIGVGPSTTVSSTPTNGIATPTPIQDKMVSNCDAFHKVVDGDGCDKIASKYGISTKQFYTWNPSVGDSCKSLWIDYYVCVSIVGVNPTPTTMQTSTTTKGNGITTPTPIQDGMTTNCKTFKKIKDGDECAAIAKNANISLANFYKWNPGVGSNCKSLWLDTYVCIAVL